MADFQNTTYYNYLGQPMPMSGWPPDDPAYSLHGPDSGGATLYAPTNYPAGVAANGGDNTIIASDGDNSYWIGPTDTVIVPDGLSGTKTIYAYHSQALPTNVNNLVFFGGGTYGVGNSLGNLIIMGGNDDNFIDGGPGNDVLVGGFGQNNFQVSAGNGDDVIYGFNANHDTVRMPGTTFSTFAQVQAAMTQVGADVVLQIDPTETLTFRGVTVSDFEPHNFLMPLDRSQLGPLTFDDEFNSLQLYDASTQTGLWQTSFYGPQPAGQDGLWNYQLSSNQEEEVYTNPNFQGTADHPLGYNPFSIDNGVISITAQPFSLADSQYAWGQSYSSGMLNTKDVFMQKYGYFEMRAELPTALGSWPAFWLSEDPYQGGAEADIMEHIALTPNDSYVRAYDWSGVTQVNEYMANPSGFHTYGMLWGPTTTTFYIDDLAVMSLPTPASWTQPMYMILDMALGGWGGPIDATALPATMQVDWIHVYGLATTPVQVEIGTPTYTAPAGVNSVTLIGAGGQTVTANGAGDALVSDNAGGNHLIGGTGNDTFTLGGGGDTATGGGGADTFLVAGLPAKASAITDFSASDRLDLTGLLSSLGYTGSSPIAAGYLKIAADGAGNAQVWANPTPSGSTWTLVTTLDGVAAGAVQMQGDVLVEGTGGGTGGGGTGGGGTGGGGPGGGSPPTTVTGSAANNYSITLEGVLRQYVVGAGGATVTGGPESANDALVGMHRIQFVDGYMDYSPTDPAGQVYRLYEATLNRAPDQEGLTNWVNDLTSGASLQSVVNGFVGSSEFQADYGSLDNTGFVTLLYQNVLHRAPDTAGLNNWVNALNSGQDTRAQVVLGFSESQEDINNLAAPVQQGLWVGNADAAEVFRLYDTTLGRLPDLSGLTNWTNMLEGGTSLQTVANGFVASAEFQANYGALNNTQFVTLLYQNVLHRAPDTAGLNNWVTDLNGGMTRAQVVVGFSESPEHIGNTAAHVDSGIWLAS